ncbi:MAG TPA: aminomethyl-transferring glycine dehydrogenase subunit GcvPA [Candidatus Goldiibacteriota bacterium]|nr:aminomethyl-transferring glycine dehydrogenase subunit GcvPA [Candidatus Goldiibacteriota bacterium]
MANFTPHTENDIKEMLAAIGAPDIDSLFSDIPRELRAASFNIPAGMAEHEAMSKISKMAAKNRTDLACFLGGGYYDHFIPAAVDAVSGRAEFYTAYTPYQPEASQGTLQAIFEYQSMMARLTGLDFSNASLYDGATALYEAIAMAVRTNNRKKVVIDAGVNPLFIRVVRTYVINQEIEIVTADLSGVSADRNRISGLLDDDTAALVMQNPNFFGTADDYTDLFAQAAARNITKILCFYPASLSALKSPSEMGADIAVADGQSLGLPLSFGGPYLGIMAASKNYVRKMPGRIVGETVDRDGKKAFVLTLQAREQHIKREKATSNICSNQALCALRAVVYLSLMGKAGFEKLGKINMQRAQKLAGNLSAIRGVKVMQEPFFNEFTVTLPVEAEKFAAKMAGCGIMAGLPASVFFPERKNELIVAVTEKRTDDELRAYCDKAMICI